MGGETVGGDTGFVASCTDAVKGGSTQSHEQPDRVSYGVPPFPGMGKTDGRS